MSPNPPERFATSWGLIASLLGMAIGAGNIWRFPRVAAQNGGGAFLIPWAIFLFLWSIPLILVEFGMGRAARRGPIGAFGAFMGRPGVVLGTFVTLCTTAIMFYYAVVTGWCAYYVVALVVDFEGLTSSSTARWYALSHGNPVAVLFHAVALGGAVLIVGRGIAGGLERINRVLIPVLLLLLGVAAVAGISLPGGARGLDYLYHVDLERLGHHRTWLEALSQSAWSTGAGWGLILTYAVYTRRRENVVSNALVAGVGNNAASLLAAMAILPAVFALTTPAEAQAALSGGNTGLLFVWMPRLFGKMAGGQVLAVIFFLAVSAAALSSLLAMMELASRVVMDIGWSRPRAVGTIGAVAFLVGLPSALSLEFFENQDWVWGLGLIVSGAFFTITAIRYGARRFREEHLRPSGGGPMVGRWFEWLLVVVIPLEFAALITWWFYGAIESAGSTIAWLSPLERFSVGTCLAQWGLVILLALFLRRWLYRASQIDPPRGGGTG